MTTSRATFEARTPSGSSLGHGIWTKFGKLDKRPGLEMIKPDFSRGMKVRSSVKKLCEGCKVGSLARSLLLET